jgi:predicted hotdog family 3-hydroxylacyl-ACP dehydratase
MTSLLPHRPPMVLLDEAVGYDDTSAVAAVTLRPDHPFAGADGVPAHVGIELMAQACGVFVGAHALARGEPVRLGVLLGSRDYRAAVDRFGIGERLEVQARLVFRDAEMGVFDCSIGRGGSEGGGPPLARARLNVYEPQNIDLILSRLWGSHV